MTCKRERSERWNGDCYAKRIIVGQCLFYCYAPGFSFGRGISIFRIRAPHLHAMKYRSSQLFALRCWRPTGRFCGNFLEKSLEFQNIFFSFFIITLNFISSLYNLRPWSISFIEAGGVHMPLPPPPSKSIFLSFLYGKTFTWNILSKFFYDKVHPKIRVYRGVREFWMNAIFILGGGGLMWPPAELRLNADVAI